MRSSGELELGQIKVADQSNEITAGPELRRALELAGGSVTVAALNGQKNSAKEIPEAAAASVLALNQLRRDTCCQAGIKGKHLNASWDHACLQSRLGVSGGNPGPQHPELHPEP